MDRGYWVGKKVWIANRYEKRGCQKWAGSENGNQLFGVGMGVSGGHHLEAWDGRGYSESMKGNSSLDSYERVI
jgi:response regulator RpfG family c-di-GMP phosphodiesterase